MKLTTKVLAFFSHFIFIESQRRDGEDVSENPSLRSHIAIIICSSPHVRRGDVSELITPFPHHHHHSYYHDPLFCGTWWSNVFMWTGDVPQMTTLLCHQNQSLFFFFFFYNLFNFLFYFIFLLTFNLTQKALLAPFKTGQILTKGTISCHPNTGPQHNQPKQRRNSRHQIHFSLRTCIMSSFTWHF